MKKKTNLGEKPIWQVWITSNYPEDNYKMVVQCDTEESYNEVIAAITKVAEDIAFKEMKDMYMTDITNNPYICKKSELTQQYDEKEHTSEKNPNEESRDTEEESR